MTNIQKIIEDFEEKFCNKPIREDLPMMRQLDKDGKLFLDHSDIKSFLLSSLLSALVSQLEVMEKQIEGMKRSVFENPPKGSAAEMSNRDHNNYNQALSDILLTLQQEKDLIIKDK